MTHKYEIVYIFDSALDEAQVNAILDRHHELLKTSGNSDPIESVNHWGTRTLAYSIKNRETGYYVVTNMRTEPSALPEFERSIKLDESIIRYLLVLNEGEVPTAPVEDDEEDDEDDDRPRKSVRAAPSRQPAAAASSSPSGQDGEGSEPKADAPETEEQKA